MSVIGSPAITTVHRLPALGDVFLDAAREMLGVGEEDRRVKAEDDHPGDLLGLGVPGHIVVAVAALDATEGRIVRPPHALQERGQRDRDGDDDALQDADDRHAEQR